MSSIPVEPSRVEWPDRSGGRSLLRLGPPRMRSNALRTARASNRAVASHHQMDSAVQSHRDFLIDIEVVSDAMPSVCPNQRRLENGVTAGLNSRERDWEQVR